MQTAHSLTLLVMAALLIAAVIPGLEPDGKDDRDLFRTRRVQAESLSDTISHLVSEEEAKRGAVTIPNCAYLIDQDGSVVNLSAESSRTMFGALLRVARLVPDGLGALVQIDDRPEPSFVFAGSAVMQKNELSPGCRLYVSLPLYRYENSVEVKSA